MSHEAGSVVLAGVAHIPKHDPGLAPDLLELLGFVGCVFVFAGIGLTNGLWRVKNGKNWFTYLFGPVVFVLGLAMTVMGFGFSFGLL
ncbi:MULTISPECIES: hypothetical protein [unclassified Streptomyces]|uniref:hypothetical protein n=1 Tax=unclassified Streptomyces TaxID=2593676 RepID=UPI00036FF292|nr:MULTISPECIES: hypothetical protein [unclassified Streptomyces]MYT32736.1 hypothetical protein [Streptomyces sp. SID8354]